MYCTVHMLNAAALRLLSYYAVCVYLTGPLFEGEVAWLILLAQNLLWVLDARHSDGLSTCKVGHVSHSG